MQMSKNTSGPGSRARFRLALVAGGSLLGGAGFGAVFEHANEGLLLGVGIFLVLLGLKEDDLLW